MLFSNRNVLLLIPVMGFSIGCFNTLGGILGEVTTYLGYDSTYTSYFGAVFILGCVAGSLTVPILL